MKTILTVIILLFCLTQTLYSQEEDGVVSLVIPVRNALKFNRFTINPTFSFVREQNKYISISNKREWLQFENAPETYLLSYSGRLKENIGVGVGLFQQNFGVLNTFGGLLNFAYNVNLQTDSNLTFGINTGFYKSGINSGAVITNFPDPSLENIPSNSLLTINPGLNYGTGFVDFGISINNLVLYNITSSKIIEDNPEQGIQAHFMYTGYVNTRGFFDESKFSGLVKSEFKKEKTILSGIAMLTVPKGIWAQLGYNTLYGVSGGLGINISNSIAIEYNFEKTIGDLATFGTSHEITLAYRFKNNNNYFYNGDDDDEVSIFTRSRRRRKRAVAKPRLDASTRTELAEARAKEIADKRAQTKLDIQERVKARAEAKERIRLAAEARAKENADRLSQVKEEANAKAQERARLAAIAKAEAEEQARLAAAEAQAQAEADERTRLAAQAQAAAAAQERARLAAIAKTEAEEQERLAAAEAQAQAEADERSRLAAQAQAAAAAQERARLAAIAKAEAEEQARLAAAEAQAQAEADERARLAAQAQAAAAAQERARLAAIAKAEAEEQARLAAAEAQAQAAAAAQERARLAALAKAEAEEQARLAAAEAQAQAEADERSRLAAQAQAAAAAQERARLAAIAKAEEEEQARLAAEEAQAQAEADERSRLAAQAQAAAAAQERARLAALAKAEAEEQARLAAAQAQQEAEAEERARLAAIAKAESDEQARLAALAQAKIDEEEQGRLAANANDEIAKSMKRLAESTKNNEETQKQLLIRLNDVALSKEKDLKDLKEENDLSEQGIFRAPKAFKSVSAENRALEALKSDIDNVVNDQDNRIAELEELYKERLKKVKDRSDKTNQYYRDAIAKLKAEQLTAVSSRADLLSTLDEIKVATEIERKRRIKRAAYDNEQDRYNQDKAVLASIKQNTPVSSVPLKTEVFDFGEEQSNNIKILKNIKNEESGCYLVLAVHSDKKDRDEFLRKAVAAGSSNINFFYDVRTSKYYIYDQKFDSVEQANTVLESKGSKPYNGKMSIVKIEN